MSGEQLDRLAAFYRELGFVGEALLFDALGRPLVLEAGPEPPGAELLWPGTPAVFYDLEGNLHRRAPAFSGEAGGEARIVGVLYGVVDLVESSEWYEQRLGLPLDFYDEASDWAELGTAEGLGVLLGFFPGEERRGVLVLDTPDAKATVEQLSARGHVPLWTRGVGWGRLALFADPAGNPVLFRERSGSG